MEEDTSLFEFDDAYQQLLFLVQQMEQDTFSLKDLSGKIADAQTLVQQCEEQLRQVEGAVDKVQEQQKND